MLNLLCIFPNGQLNRELLERWSVIHKNVPIKVAVSNLSLEYQATFFRNCTYTYTFTEWRIRKGRQGKIRQSRRVLYELVQIAYCERGHPGVLREYIGIRTQIYYKHSGSGGSCPTVNDFLRSIFFCSACPSSAQKEVTLMPARDICDPSAFYKPPVYAHNIPMLNV